MSDDREIRKFESPYPGYDVLDKWDTPSFDEATRRVVSERLNRRWSSPQFFEPGEYRLLRAVMDTVLPQTERGEEERIPVEAFLDENLHANVTDGTRHVDMPPQREAWRQGLAAIDVEARGEFDRGFAELAPGERHAVLERIDTGKAGGDHWKALHPKRFFRNVVLKQAVKIYYSHPLAWNEIGFGGPAAPRGYLRLGPNMRDPWEAREERRPQKAEQLP